MGSPLVSVVLPVKNAWPHVRTAVDAIRRQTYQCFELIVQDGGSTDSTLDYLSALRGWANLQVVSEPDTGIGQAYSRGVKRASGDLICFAATDEFLEDDALERAIGWVHENPHAIVVNGSVRMRNAAGEAVDVFESPHFDLLRHLECEVVLAFAGLLDRRKIGGEFYYDESLTTCPDYDFWIRLGTRFEPRQFVAVKQIFKTARADRASMSFRAESFTQFCRDKLFILHRFLAMQPAGALIEALGRSASAGIYLWAAESVLALDGPSPAFMQWCQEAARIDPWASRLQALAVKTAAFSIDERTGAILVAAERQPDSPSGSTLAVPNGLALERAFSLPQWTGAAVERGKALVVQTGRGAWTYAAEIPLAMTGALNNETWCWARFELEVLAGQIGIGPIAGNDLLYEETVAASRGRTTVFLKVANPRVTGIMIRNSGLSEPSRVRILGASVECAPRSA